MARKTTKKSANRQLEGAGEFLGADTEKEALDRIAAAKAAAETEAEQDNGGPVPTLRDEAAWRRAANELKAETIELEALAEKVAEVRGRISSIKKVAEKCGVDWDVVKLYNKYEARIRKGGMGEIVTEQRRLGALMRYMESPLHTQFSMFPEEATTEEAKAANDALDAELQGQLAYRQGAKLTDNIYNAATDTEKHNDWHRGWVNAQNATAASMGPGEGEAAH